MRARKGFNTDQIEAIAFGWKREILNRAKSELTSIAAEAEDEVRTVIRTSITKTGQARQAAGEGVPGRIETGDMHDGVDSRVEEDGDDVVATWGWDASTFEEYMAHQEDGTRFIAPMNALGYSLARAEDQLRGRLDRIVGRP